MKKIILLDVLLIYYIITLGLYTFGIVTAQVQF